MLGGMLAGHDECEGEIVSEERDGQQVPVGMTFYGMSSQTAMEKYSGGVADYRASEGKTVTVPYRGPVEATTLEITGGAGSQFDPDIVSALGDVLVGRTVVGRVTVAVAA